jgi:hypothetical protein
MGSSVSFLARLHLTIVHNLRQKSKPMLVWYIGSKIVINIGMNTYIKYQTNLVWPKKSGTSIIPVLAGITISCYQTNTGPNLSPCPSSVTYVCCCWFKASTALIHSTIWHWKEKAKQWESLLQQYNTGFVYKVEFSILKKSFLSP